jgi:hypothetical protein
VANLQSKLDAIQKQPVVEGWWLVLVQGSFKSDWYHLKEGDNQAIKLTRKQHSGKFSGGYGGSSSSEPDYSLGIDSHRAELGSWGIGGKKAVCHGGEDGLAGASIPEIGSGGVP